MTSCPRRPSRPLLVLFYNDFFGSDPAAEPPAGCRGACVFTSDRRRFRDADAVVFHIPGLPYWSVAWKRRGQKWVAWSMESDVNYPQLKDPRFMSRFDFTQTYRLDSDFPVLYLGQSTGKALRTPPIPKTADAPAAMFISNRRDRSGRVSYAREMMRHIAIHSYGKCLRNRETDADDGRQTKLKIIARYKFTLAFENSIARDYVTEKFFDPLIAGSVPVYMGAPNIDEFAPGDHCFINAAGFGSPRKLAEYLNALGSDEDRYAAYLSWKRKPFRKRFLELVESQRTDARCRLCRRLQASGGL